MQCNRLHNPTIHDVAKAAGVSVATVSRAFNLPEKVSESSRERIHEAARSLGFNLNIAARTLRTQRSRVIGVVLPTLLNPVFAECLEGIAQAASLAGYSILPITSNYRLDAEERAVNLLLAGNAAAMVLAVSNPAASPALDRLRDSGVPYVLVYNRHDKHPCVSVDSQEAVAAAVGRLVRLGHSRIAMVHGQLSASDRAMQRFKGYLQGMASESLTPNVLEVPFVDAAIQRVQEFLKRANRPTAIICSNDLLAIRCVRAASRGGVRVPQQLSVVGFDGIALGEDLTPALSTVVQPNAGIGQAAAELVIQALSADKALGKSSSLTLPWTFREGESCAKAKI